MKAFRFGLISACFAVGFSTADAATVNDVASGSVSQVNTFPNIILDAANNRSDYFVFDLSSLIGQLAGQAVGSAVLTITSPGFYSSSDATENFALWDFNGDVNALRNYSYPSNQPSNPVAVRDDLRSGISYGSTVIAMPAGGALPNIEVTLNAAAISAINLTLASSNNLFALGGFSDTLTGSQLLFQSSSAAPNARLDLQPVPVPAAAWLFGSAVLGMAGVNRRKLVK